MHRFILLVLITLFSLIRPLSGETSPADQASSIPDFYHSVNVIDGEFLDSRVDLAASGPHGFEIKRWSFPNPGSNTTYAHGWAILPLDLFNDTGEKPKESVLSTYKMVYDYDKQGSLKGIQVQALDGKILFSELKLTANSQNKLDIETSTGQKLGYEFQIDTDKRKLLSSVQAPGQPEIRYTYQPHAFEKRKVIASRNEPQGRSLQIEYYSASDAKQAGEFSKGKVKTLKAPAGPDSTLTTIARFVYRPGETEVYDALNHKTIYKYSSDNRLSSVESQHPDGKTSSTYRIHRFFWKDHKLVAKTLEDEQKRVFQCETFVHDSKGRIIKETLWGNLTGNQPNPFSVDSNGQPQGQIESYSKIYTFANDESGQLTTIKEDNGKEVRYSYDPTTKLPVSQFVVHQNQTLLREFYFYSSNGFLQKTIIDDGRSANSNDLSGVTERHIQTIAAFAPAPNLSLAQVIEESLLDLQSGQEKLLKKKVFAYSSNGKIISQEVYDGAGILQENTRNTYDKQGHLMSSTNLEGISTTYSYDELGNPTRRTSSKDQMDTQFVYDYANRLIREDELTTDGKLRGITNAYDLIGNKIACTDSCGNTTHFTYDALNRLITTTYPAVLDAHGHSVNYQMLTTYNIFDRAITTVDTEGHKKETHYNVRGKPTEIHYADGTFETAHYNLDGTLQQAIDRKGNTITTTYDSLGNPTEVIIKSPKGQLVQRIKSTYNGFRLLSTEDMNGKKTEYACEDAAQKQTAVPKVEDSIPAYKEIEQKVSNGRGQWVRQLSLTDYQGMTTDSTMDALNRIETVVKKDPYGRILAQTDYLYDASGNTCRETHTVITNEGPERKFVIAKSWGYDRQLLEVIEGEGSPQQKITRYAYTPQGLLKAIQKPDGNTILQEYNDFEQLVRLYASDNSFDYGYTYDAQGSIVKAEDFIHHQSTERTFDSEGRLIAEKLGSGLRSVWDYDKEGRLTKSILPDQSSIQYQYEAANLVGVERIRNGKTYLHRYTHDLTNGKVIEAEMMGGIGTIRYGYNVTGLPVSLQTPYWSQQTGPDGRDKLGRMTQSTYTDPLGTTHAEYHYDPLSRMSQEKGSTTHTYTYDSIDNRLSDNGHPIVLDGLNQVTATDKSTFSYDANGNVILEQKSQQAARHFTYDAFNRLTKVAISDNEAYQYIYDPFNRRIAKTHLIKDPQSGTWNPAETQHYLYYGEQEIGVADTSGQIKELRVLGIGIGAEIGAAVLIELHGHTFVPIHDLQGSVRCLVDIDTKAIAEFYRYSAFGETLLYDGSGQSLTSSIIGNSWMYSSKRLDTESGLYFYGKRYYAPDLGRWFTPDPLGFADGPNLYAFVHQNPLNIIDLYGLFSFGDLWNVVTDFFSDCFKVIGEFFNAVGNWFKTYLSPTAVKDYLHFITYELIGKGFAFLKGDSNFRSFRGVFGYGEINDKVRLTFINGIYTEPQHLADNVEGISKTHGGINVHYVYSATRGFILDSFRALRIKLGFTSPEAYMLADTWRQLIAEMGGTSGGGTIVHYAHSIGAGDTERALMLMSSDERAMIQVTTFGSPVLIGNDLGVAHISNYVNIGDLASMFHPIKYFKALFSGDHSIHFVGNMEGFPIIAHLFGSPAYRRVCETLGRYFVQLYKR